MTKNTSLFVGKKALQLDMNGTLMFAEDRFGESEDFSMHYFTIGGTLPRDEINSIIRSVYAYLETKYPDDHYRHNFPTLESAINVVVETKLTPAENKKIIDTFAFHELGEIPEEYCSVLHKLKQHFLLAAVIDIWSPKQAWLNHFKMSGVSHLFSAISFSSDHGIVKPSPMPFQWVLNQLGILNSEGIVVGDSPRRDLGGAKAANIDCLLVGGASHKEAIACYKNLLEFYNAVELVNC